MTRHMLWTALSFLASAVVAGGLFGGFVVVFRERIHDTYCACERM